MKIKSLDTFVRCAGDKLTKVKKWIYVRYVEEYIGIHVVCLIEIINGTVLDVVNKTNKGRKNKMNDFILASYISIK